MPPYTRYTDKARTDLLAVQAAAAELEAENSRARQQLADAVERRREEEGAVEAARQRAAALAREKAELSSTAVAAQRQASSLSNLVYRGHHPWTLHACCPSCSPRYTEVTAARGVDGSAGLATPGGNGVIS